jgi:hypothetical protein
MDVDGLRFALLYTPAKTVIRKLGREFEGSIFGQSSLNACFGFSCKFGLFPL